MMIAIKLAGYSWLEADKLRKAMGKKKREEMDKLKVKFIEGCKKNNHDEKIAHKVWQDWEAFAEYAFNYAGIEIEWQGKGVNEKGLVRSLASTASSSALNTGDVIVEIDPHYFRPTEVDFLLADASKAREKLGWKPRVTFNELVKIMIDADMELIGIKPQEDGKAILREKGIHWTENKLTAG